MSGLTKAGVWVLLAVTLLLPLYELADYTEVWQHDSDLAACGLFFLLAGMALLAGRTVETAVILIVRAFIEMADPCAGRSPRQRDTATTEFPISPPRTDLSLLCCDLRI
jgi:hypothetical protein